MKIKDLKLDNNFNITRFSYKPGWSVSFYEYLDLFCNYEIRIMHRIQPDASIFKTIETYNNYEKNPQNGEFEKIPIVMRSIMTYESFKEMKETDFWNYLFEQVRSAEMHEIKEWFKIDGKYLRNPHPEDPMGAAGIPESECFNA